MRLYLALPLPLHALRTAGCTARPPTAARLPACLPACLQAASLWARQTWTSLPAAWWAHAHPTASQVRRRQAWHPSAVTAGGGAVCPLRSAAHRRRTAAATNCQSCRAWRPHFAPVYRDTACSSPSVWCSQCI